MNPSDYVGEDTLKKMQNTKWWALARFVDQLLYDGRVVTTTGSGEEQKIGKPKEGDSRWSKHFLSSSAVHLSGVPDWLKVPGRDGNYYDTERVLREIMHECERMAMREVCK